MSPARSLRTWGMVIQVLGIVLTVGGACGLIVAAALPWALFTVLGQPIQVPGVLVWGSVTAAIGLLVLAVLGTVRRFPLLAFVLGIAACFVGYRANAEVGMAVKDQLLRFKQSVSPINRRLEQVNVPPIEPFGAGIGSHRDYTGIGPLYTEYAGAMVAGGSLVLLLGGRVRRTCRYCKRAWSIKHGDEVAFCPRCGKHSGPMPTCPRCAATVDPNERFCVRCGENIQQTGNKPPRLQT